jgi:hypothetical protein
VAQNAVRHGLAGQIDVVSWEDPAEYERLHTRMLAELAPAGVMEEMLAERVVSLTWRLRRAQYIQHEATEAIAAKPAQPAKTGPVLADLIAVLRARQENKPLPVKLDPQIEEAHWIGTRMVADWATRQVLERMMMYERRIESSLYRTVNELQRLRLMRKLEADAEVGEGMFQTTARRRTTRNSEGAAGGRCPPCETAQAQVSRPKTEVEEDTRKAGETPATRAECAEQSQFAGSRHQAAGIREQGSRVERSCAEQSQFARSRQDGEGVSQTFATPDSTEDMPARA